MQNSKEKTLSQRIAERIIKYILDENLQPWLLSVQMRQI